jgi:hypothetical protein
MLRTILLVSCLTLAGACNEAVAQETTAEDFKAFGELWVGRWTADVTLITDWPWTDKKAGDKLTAHQLHVWAADGKAIIDTNLGEQTSNTLWGYDPATKRIFAKFVNSGGMVFELAVAKETDSKWTWEIVSGGFEDSKLSGNGHYEFDDDGRILHITGDVKIDGVSTPQKLDHTWHRMDK